MGCEWCLLSIACKRKRAYWTLPARIHPCERFRRAWPAGPTSFRPILGRCRPASMCRDPRSAQAPRYRRWLSCPPTARLRCRSRICSRAIGFWRRRSGCMRGVAPFDEVRPGRLRSDYFPLHLAENLHHAPEFVRAEIELHGFDVFNRRRKFQYCDVVHGGPRSTPRRWR